MTITADDRLQIEELAARYNLAIDLGDAKAWVSCFSADGEFAITKVGPFSGTVLGLAEGRWRGAGELRAFATAVTSGRSFRHWSYNRVLTIASGGIDSISYMNVHYLDRPPPEQLVTGIMRDRLVQDNAEWRFASRRIEFDR
jgi:hypothetical protein